MKFERRMRSEKRKALGSHYTPEALARFVAKSIFEHVEQTGSPLSVLDPAVGDGELLKAMLSENAGGDLTLQAFDIDQTAYDVAKETLQPVLNGYPFQIEQKDFIEDLEMGDALFQDNRQYDLCISNPPYVRTQVLGAEKARQIAKRFNLTGRIDLYQAFILGIAYSLKPGGILGIIVSNRFISTKTGASVRREIAELFEILHVWDLGDTRLFEAAVLPSVLILRRKGGNAETVTPRFSSIYEVKEEAVAEVPDVISALQHNGLVRSEGRTFRVQHGTLDWGDDPSSVWRLASEESDTWLSTIERHTSYIFKDLGKIRVGVKTTADKVFCKKEWPNGRPELARPLITHHVGDRYIGGKAEKEILYPHKHDERGGKRVMDLEPYPISKAYLESHREQLENRSYVIKAGRRWYEIWVPQDPASWDKPKLIFRDIAEQAMFWMDNSGAVVNGDCYWLVLKNGLNEDLLWLALAVGNSQIATDFYDRKFNNRLYAGRKRFMTQYVEQFPIPDPTNPNAQEAVRLVKDIYGRKGKGETTQDQEDALEQALLRAFGLAIKEVAG